MAIKDSMHSDFSTGSGVWIGYRHDLTGDYFSRNGTGENHHEFADGTFREFNRKLDNIDIVDGESLYFEPYDAGFRFNGNPFIHSYEGCAAAYSVRTVGFGGPLMRVRRNSDDEEVDVRGDVNGEISLSSPIIGGSENETLGEYIGTASGFCSIWYDQSNTGAFQNNAIQAADASQPMLVSGGSLITDANGKARLNFDGSNDLLAFTDGYNIGNLSSFLVSQSNVANQISIQLSLGGDGTDPDRRWYAPFYNGGGFKFRYATDSYPSGEISVGSDVNMHLFTAIAGETQGNFTAFMDSDSLGSTTRATGITSDTVGIGGFATTSALPFNGKVSEVFVFSSDQSPNRSAIEGNINSFYNIYS